MGTFAGYLPEKEMNTILLDTKWPPVRNMLWSELDKQDCKIAWTNPFKFPLVHEPDPQILAMGTILDE